MKTVNAKCNVAFDTEITLKFFWRSQNTKTPTVSASKFYCCSRESKPEHTLEDLNLQLDNWVHTVILRGSVDDDVRVNAGSASLADDGKCSQCVSLASSLSLLVGGTCGGTRTGNPLTWVTGHIKNGISEHWIFLFLLILIFFPKEEYKKSYPMGKHQIYGDLFTINSSI